METLKFVLVCAAVFAGIILVAWLCEKRLTHDRKLFSSTHYISYRRIRKHGGRANAGRAAAVLRPVVL